MENQEENSGGGGKKAIEKIAGGGMKKTIIKLVMAYNALTYFLIIFFGIVIIFSVFPSSSPASELDGGTSNIPADKEGSVGYFHDIIKEKTGLPATVGSGCNDGRRGGRRHNGYDLSFPAGTPVYAVYPGEVSDLKPQWYPYVINKITHYEAAVYIKKEHPDRDGAQYYSYGHLQPGNIKVSDGQKVDQGTLLGYVSRDHLDMKKSANPDITPPTRICNGGTTAGLPSNKYEVW